MYAPQYFSAAAPTFYGASAFPTAFASQPYAFAQPLTYAEAPVSSAASVHDDASSASGLQAEAPAFTYLPAAAPTYLAPLTYVPAPAPRRPGYNERLVAWRNRQKAFDKYKKATKAAIKAARNAPEAVPEWPAPFFHPAPLAAEPFYYGAPVAAEAYPTFADFGSYSSASRQQAAEEPQVEAHDEPEIRGTQV